jgi:adenylosuccinate synthase
VGCFDCVATLYGCRVQGATEVVITNLDVLGYLDRIPVCTGYSVEGKTTSMFPVSRLLNAARPVYEELPGWKTDVSTVRSFEKLPGQARDYVLFVEKRIGTLIKWVSVGPHRDQIIRR